jgi:hypothetical protein
VNAQPEPLGTGRIEANSGPGASAHIPAATTPGSTARLENSTTSSQPPTVSRALQIDELPWLLEGIPGGAGELQRVWDRELARRPVLLLLLLLGSDLGMMERLEGYDQPLDGRATPMVLEVLNPAEVAAMTGLVGADASDAAVITGGQPLVAQDWQPGEPPTEFVRRAFESPTSALIVAGVRVLDTEFPPDTNPRRVLTAIGGRGRPDRAFEPVARGYPAWRGRAVEPVVRHALMRLLPDGRWPAVRQVGGWWSRSNTPRSTWSGRTATPRPRSPSSGRSSGEGPHH